MTAKRYILFALLIVISSAVVYLLFFRSTGISNSWKIITDETVDSNSRQSDKSLVHLYFSDKENSYLKAEDKILFHSHDPVDFCRSIVKALIDGPDQELMRTVPEGTKLKALYITNDGTAFVDFSEELSKNHPGGSKTELLTVFSIVNSLILNVPQVEDVKILIDSQEPITLAGHIDVRFPFRANMLLIK